MSKFNNLIIKSTTQSIKFENHSYLWFRYHRLFFGSLLKKVKNCELLIFWMI